MQVLSPPSACDHGDHPPGGLYPKERESRPRVLYASDFDASTSHGAKGGLATGARRLAPRACVVSISWVYTEGFCIKSLVKRTTCATKFDVKGIDAVIFASVCGVLSCQHGRVGRRFVTIRLDLHPTSDSGNGLAAPIITGQFSSDTSANIAGRHWRSFAARFSIPV